MSPDPLSYNMSDVNPHLTRCEPPTLLKGWIRPCKNELAVQGNGDSLMHGSSFLNTAVLDIYICVNTDKKKFCVDI